MGMAMPAPAAGVGVGAEQTLEPLHSFGEGVDRAIRRAAGEAHERDLERDAWIGRLSHLEQRLAHRLERPGGRRDRRAVRPNPRPASRVGDGDVFDRRAHPRQEDVAQAG